MMLRSNRLLSCALVSSVLVVLGLSACGGDDAPPVADPCALAVNPCGAGECVNLAGAYVCTCPAGYRLASTPTLTCADIDECAEGITVCTQVPMATCANTVGSYDCACPPGYLGTGRGGGGCVADEPLLEGLVVGDGALLSPAFASSTTMYAVTLAVGETATTLTPTVVAPARMTVTVDGALVASGASAALDVGFAPRPVEVVVTTTASGATTTYTVVLSRSESTYVKASNTGAGDGLGACLSLSADGTRLAVGAPREGSSATGVDGDQANDSAPSSGAVYVFARTGASWAQEVYLKASNTQLGDTFGSAVALSADGLRLAVGAAGEDSTAAGIDGDQSDNSALGSGAVYVFARTGTSWAQEAYVKASNAAAADSFGAGAVSLSADGLRLAVGAGGEDSSATGIDGDQGNNAAAGSGAVYVFARSGTSWAQEAYVKASNSAAGDNFGARGLSLSADGTRFAVGASSEDSAATGIDGDQADNSAPNSGAVYVFGWAGTHWAQEAYVKASNTGANDSFGDSAVSMSGDGAWLAVGGVTEASSATGIDGDQANDGAVDSGAVYVFSRTGTTWRQEVYLKASNTRASAYFGMCVAISVDGTRLAVGAYGDTSSATGINGDQADTTAAYSGAAYVFTRTGTTWAQEAYVKASNTDVNDTFGFALSLSADGQHLAVGAEAEDSSAVGFDGDQSDDTALSSGAVYAY